MIPRHPRTISSESRNRFVIPAICQLLAALAVYANVDETLAQRTYPDEPWGRDAITEIWMTGDDVAVTRRVPSDDRARAESDDKMAQFMATMAAQRFNDADPKNAEWLAQWAKKLSHGQIDASSAFRPGTDIRDQPKLNQSQPPQASSAAETAPLTPRAAGLLSLSTDPLLAPAPPTRISFPVESPAAWNAQANANQAIDPQRPELGHASTLSEANLEEPELPIFPDDTPQPETTNSVARSDHWPDARSTEPTTDAPRTRSDFAVNSMEPADVTPETAQEPTSETRAHATNTYPVVLGNQPRPLTRLDDRQVATAAPLSGPTMTGFEQSVRRAVSRPDSIEQPTFLVLASFTAGFVFCVGLVALIVLSPRRYSPRESTIITSGPSIASPLASASDIAASKEHVPHDRQAVAATTIPLSSPTSGQRETVEPDTTNALVEDFFNSNVELLKQCA